MKISPTKIEMFQAEAGMGVVELAKKSGISYQNFCVIKRRTTCRPQTAGRIARALGVGVAEIMEDNQP